MSCIRCGRSAPGGCGSGTAKSRWTRTSTRLWRRTVPTTAEAPGSPLAVTVAVCTRDRPEDLARCLDALAALRYPGLELLVVDNAPATRDAHGVVAARPGVRYAVEPRPGLGWARNRALAEATGEILA